MDFDELMSKFCREQCRLFPGCVKTDIDEEDNSYCPLIDFAKWINEKLN